MRFFKKLFCDHTNKKFIRNINGDEILQTGGKRSVWQCEDCETILFCNNLHGEKPRKTKVYFDTEFTGLHKNTTLVSIGLIAESGEKFYAEFTDFDREQVDFWIQENVIKNLWCNSGRFDWDLPDFYYYSNKAKIKEELTKWFSQFNEVQLISDVCHYDMVLLINIFGTAFDMPMNVCPTCHDINQDLAKFLDISEKEAFDLNREDFAKQYCNVESVGYKHNAINDAEIIKAIYEKLNKQEG